jgi:heme-degrading monooxygenase HmoA
MVYLLVQLTVQDFDQWKPYFDSNAAERQAAGAGTIQVFRNAREPNEITILFEWDSGYNAQRFVASQNMREMMKKSGVMGSPTFVVLDKVD